MKPNSKKRPAQEPTTTFVVIQTILTQWSKASRGGERAGIRNQVPEALELEPLSELPTAPAYIIHGSNHMIDHVLHPGGAPPNTVQAISTSFIADCVRVFLKDDVVHADFYWNGQGMPERPTRPDVLLLQPGQWGRIVYNVRRSPGYAPHSWDWPWWWYEKWCFNIGLFSTYSPQVFLDTKPLLIYSQMADLW